MPTLTFVSFLYKSITERKPSSTFFLTNTFSDRRGNVVSCSFGNMCSIYFGRLFFGCSIRRPAFTIQHVQAFTFTLFVTSVNE